MNSVMQTGLNIAATTGTEAAAMPVECAITAILTGQEYSVVWEEAGGTEEFEERAKDALVYAIEKEISSKVSGKIKEKTSSKTAAENVKENLNKRTKAFLGDTTFGSGSENTSGDNSTPSIDFYANSSSTNANTMDEKV